MSKPVCVLCSATRVVISMLAPASSTNDAAICVPAKIRWSQPVLPVIRTLPLAILRPLELSPEGKRGINARITAATMASAAPTHSRLKSTFNSRARTEYLEA